jgi:DNA-binding MarR family transcriptional regulator
MPEEEAVLALPADLAGEALHKFLRINRYLHQYARQVNEHGLPPRQFSVLRRLLEDGPATVGALQEYLYSSASVASTVISQLEEAGFVTRTRSPQDNRVVIVALTDAGRDLARNTPMGGIVLLRRKLATLPEARLRTIDAALTDIMELMGVTDEA